jgi:hypothetical protein
MTMASPHAQLSTHSPMRDCLCNRKKRKRKEEAKSCRDRVDKNCNSQVQRVVSKNRVRERQVIKIIIMRKAEEE